MTIYSLSLRQNFTIYNFTCKNDKIAKVTFCIFWCQDQPDSQDSLLGERGQEKDTLVGSGHVPYRFWEI